MIAALLLFTLFSAFYFLSIQNICDAFIDEKYDDKKLCVDLLCDEIDALALDNPLEILARVITKIDGHDGTICGLYDDKLQIVSSRSPLFGVKPFAPANYPDLVHAVANGKVGSLNVWYDSEGLPPHTIKVYYRWSRGFIVIMGTSKYTASYEAGLVIRNVTIVLSLASVVFFLFASILLLRERKRAYGQSA